MNRKKLILTDLQEAQKLLNSALENIHQEQQEEGFSSFELEQLRYFFDKVYSPVEYIKCTIKGIDPIN